MHPLNLGTLAYGDARRTSLTERLLYAVGAIDQTSSVDKGNTQTDTLDPERQRGNSIKAISDRLTLDFFVSQRREAGT
jgi:ribosomal protection tetracycline resistance protein